jgi:hypothetical protein
VKIKAPVGRNKFSPALAKGQLWKMDHAHIQITELGKRLVHYRMLQDLRQMRPSQMTDFGTLERYLRTNRAKLVKGRAANGPARLGNNAGAMLS